MELPPGWSMQLLFGPRTVAGEALVRSAGPARTALAGELQETSGEDHCPEGGARAARGQSGAFSGDRTSKGRRQPEKCPGLFCTFPFFSFALRGSQFLHRGIEI